MLGYKTRNTCRICGSKKIKQVYKVEEMYVSDFPTTPTGHRGKAPMTLVECKDCSLVQLKESISEEIYKDYWYESKLNKKIVKNLKEIAENAGHYVNIDSGDIALDIGANDGTLLSYIPQELTKVGIDPAETIQEDLKRNCDIAVCDFFSASVFKEAIGNVSAKAKIITSIAMFYDLDDPHSFVADIKEILAANGVWITQFMPMSKMVQVNDVGNIIHEHIMYYTYESVKRLLAEHNLTIFDVQENDINGGSFQLWIGHSTDVVPAAFTEDTVDVTAWAKDMDANKQVTIDFLKQCKKDNKKVYIYGASTKGNTIAQFYGITPDLVEGAAEIHPNKVGRYMVGTGIPIVHEDDARKDADYFLVMPFGFRDVFVSKETDVDLVFCTPKFEIVNV
jgi:NDP-4-keto-2,6-dideoxyhexose 3-C-methyltransferase